MEIGHSRPRRTRALTVVGLLVSLVFAYFALRDVEFSRFWSSLASSDYWWLVPCLGALALTVFIKAVRWRLLFSPTTRPPLRAVTIALLIGHFFNNVLPARAGDAARVVALYQQARTSRAESAGTVVSERITDVLALLALLFLARPFLPSVSWLDAAALLAAVVLGVALVLVLVLARYGDRPFRAAVRPLGRIPGVPAGRFEHAAENLVRGLISFRQPRIAAANFGLAVAATLTLALSFWFVMIGFDLRVGFGAGLLVVIATNLAMILPSSPAAVGVFEAAALIALEAYGVDNSLALSYAVVVHVANFVPFVVVGYAILHWHVLARRRVAVPPPAAQGASVPPVGVSPLVGAEAAARSPIGAEPY